MEENKRSGHISRHAPPDTVATTLAGEEEEQHDTERVHGHVREHDRPEALM